MRARPDANVIRDLGPRGRREPDRQSPIPVWPMAEIRFLWIPQGASGPALRIHSTQAHHFLVDVRAQSRDSVVAVSSASDPFNIVSWVFSINFAAERVMAASVGSNPAGLRGLAVRLSCSFEDPAPRAAPPAPGSSIG